VVGIEAVEAPVFFGTGAAVDARNGLGGLDTGGGASPPMLVPAPTASEDVWRGLYRARRSGVAAPSSHVMSASAYSERYRSAGRYQRPSISACTSTGWSGMPAATSSRASSRASSRSRRSSSARAFGERGWRNGTTVGGVVISGGGMVRHCAITPPREWYGRRRTCAIRRRPSAFNGAVRHYNFSIGVSNGACAIAPLKVRH
jgi:hypothetical protein